MYLPLVVLQQAIRPGITVMYATCLLYFLVSLAGSVLGDTYSLSDSHQGIGFNIAFSYQAITDPTNGRVYVPFLHHIIR